MIVTEGSLDVHTLERNLARLFPDIADFFDFIEIKLENPFPGVGNLVTFSKGFSRIRYDGRMSSYFITTRPAAVLLKQFDPQTLRQA